MQPVRRCVARGPWPQAGPTGRLVGWPAGRLAGWPQGETWIHGWLVDDTDDLTVMASHHGRLAPREATKPRRMDDGGRCEWVAHGLRMGCAWAAYGGSRLSRLSRLSWLPGARDEAFEVLLRGVDVDGHGRQVRGHLATAQRRRPTTPPNVAAQRRRPSPPPNVAAHRRRPSPSVAVRRRRRQHRRRQRRQRGGEVRQGRVREGRREAGEERVTREGGSLILWAKLDQ